MKTSHPKGLEAVYYWEKRNKAKEIPVRIEFVKITSMLKPVEKLGYIKCYSSGSSDQAILSDTTVRRSAVNQQDLKPYWKS